MANSASVLMRFIRSRAIAELTDEELLRHYRQSRDERAFAELVDRHGSLVFGVCRRILFDHHEAEDAFQAVFLILARKAGSLGQPDRLSSWLHGVACLIARKARKRMTRRAVPIQTDFDLPATRDEHAHTARELKPLIDEAVRGLPEKYREPVVLCYLEGLSNLEAARRLGCPLGTIATRLSRARDQLRLHFTRRGLALPAALFSAALAQACEAPIPSATLLEAAGTQLTGTVAFSVFQLTKGIGENMIVAKFRNLFAATLLAGIGGFGWFSYHAGAGEPPITQDGKKEEPKAPVTPPQAIAPVPIATATEPTDAAVPARSANFIVHCSTYRMARIIADMAEVQRKRIAENWLRQELPDWKEPCAIRVQITNKENGAGATSFKFAREGIGMNMRLEGSLTGILADVLPHEITHTVMATYFRKPIPRWVDEGFAILSESDEKQRLHLETAKAMAKARRVVHLLDLLSAGDFPRDTAAFFADSYSLTRFLLERKNGATLFEFVKDGLEGFGGLDGGSVILGGLKGSSGGSGTGGGVAGSWAEAARKHYGFKDLDALETAWLSSLKNDTPSEASGTEFKGVVPMSALAVSSADRQMIKITIRTMTATAVTSYVMKEAADGSKSYHPVTNYKRGTKNHEIAVRADRVKAFELDGKAIETKTLVERLTKETPILFASESADEKVDPFYLQVIKPGTMILFIHVEPLPAPLADAAVEPPTSAPVPILPGR